MASKPLGSIAKTRTPPKEEKRGPEGYGMRRVMRFAMQSEARELLPRRRVAYCMRRFVGGKTTYVELWGGDDVPRGRLGNLMTCNSKWDCTICAYRVSMAEFEKVKAALGVAAERNYTVVQAAFTLRHDRGDRLSVLVDALADAFIRVRRGKLWAEFRKEFSVVGYFTSQEVTVGLENGWHPHRHVTFLCGAPLEDFDQEAFDVRLTSRYRKFLQDRGRFADERHGVKMEFGLASDADAGYVAKWGLADGVGVQSVTAADWGMAGEMTKGHLKAGRDGHWAPFQLLGLIVDGHHLAEWAGYRFKEYSSVYHGKRQLVASRRLMERLGLKGFCPAAEIPDSVTKADQLLALLDHYQWAVILERGKRGQFEALGRSNDVGRVVAFLRMLGVPRVGEVLDRLDVAREMGVDGTGWHARQARLGVLGEYVIPDEGGDEACG